MEFIKSYKKVNQKAIHAKKNLQDLKKYFGQGK